MPSSHVFRTEFVRSVDTIKQFVKEKGPVATAGEVAAVAAGQLTFPIVRSRRREDRFDFRGLKLPYTLERYNNAYRNERTVEISIAKWFVGDVPGRLLEVGNVLSYYGVHGHAVLDKYEEIPGVLNEDIVDFVPEEPFDTVIAVSTLEHVGWDETPRRPDNVLRAFESVRNAARSGGRVLVTVPIGHNDRLDSALRSGEISFPEESWLVRTNQRNEWAESDRETALTKRYGAPFRNANAVYVGTINA